MKSIFYSKQDEDKEYEAILDIEQVKDEDKQINPLLLPINKKFPNILNIKKHSKEIAASSWGDFFNSKLFQTLVIIVKKFRTSPKRQKQRWSSGMSSLSTRKYQILRNWKYCECTSLNKRPLLIYQNYWKYLIHQFTGSERNIRGILLNLVICFLQKYLT